MKTNKGLVEYAKTKNQLHLQGKTMYMLGAFGRILSGPKISGMHSVDERIKRCAHTRANERTIRGGIGRYAFDCVGLIKGYLWETVPGRTMYNVPPGSDQNVRGMWASAVRKGPLNTMPDIPGMLVYTADLGHVGVYIGKNTKGEREYIEATPGLSGWPADKRWGVALTNDNLRKWESWGQYHLIEYIEDKPEVADFTYTVVAGDTLNKIAAAYKTTWSEILEVNTDTIKNKDRIEIGQVLKMPKDAIAPVIAPTYVRYTVKSGDTLSRIANSFRISVDSLYSLNRSVIGNNPNIIRVGMVLNIPERVAAPAPTPTPAPSPAFKIGDKIKLTGITYATGSRIPSWVKLQTYEIRQIDLTNNRVLVSKINSWVRLNEIRKV